MLIEMPVEYCYRSTVIRFGFGVNLKLRGGIKLPFYKGIERIVNKKGTRFLLGHVQSIA